MARSEWSFKSAVELSAALTAKKVSSVELTQGAIDRIERHDGKINAICVRDFDRALDAARAGLEYYADFGEIGNFKKLSDQSHTLFAVTDFKVGDFGVNFGVGYGLTPASDRLVVKTIIGYAFPVPGAAADANARMNSGPVNPFAHASARSFQP